EAAPSRYPNRAGSFPDAFQGRGRDLRARFGALTWEVFMRTPAHHLATTGLVLLAALAVTPAGAADLDVTSAVDAVTVYPDGASVTRVITLDLPAGDNTLVARDFPLTLDASSLRVEGEAGARLTIGAIDT